MDVKYKKLVKNSFWTLIGNTGSKILSFLFLPLYTRWLGTSGFGESDLIITYSSFAVCIMTMCVSDAIFVFTKNQKENNICNYFTIGLFFTVVLLIVWMGVMCLLSLVFECHNLTNSFSTNLWYIYGIVVSTFFQTYFQQFILGIEKIKIYALTGIIHTLLTFIASFLFIPSMGVRGYILSIIISNLLTAFYTFFCSKSYYYVSLRIWDWGKVAKILRYSIPLIPNSIMWWLVGALNRPVMEYYLDLSQIGIFAAANRFPGVITMVFTVFSTAWNISVFEEYGKPDYDGFYKKTFKMLFTAIVVLSCVSIFFSELIVSIFVAPEFHEAWKYLAVLIIGSFFSCVSGFFAANFSVVKQSKFFFYSSVWGALTAIITNCLLIPRFGLWGASLSVVFSFLAMSISRYIYSNRFVKASILVEFLYYSGVIVTVTIVCVSINNLLIKLLLTSILILMLVFFERKSFISFITLVMKHIYKK